MATEKKDRLKVVLCSVPQNIKIRSSVEPPVNPKMAIVSLLKWMEKSGYSGQFFDIDMLLPSEDEIRNYFKSILPDIVGLSAVVSTSYAQVKELSRIIRETCPTAWIAVGGNMAVSANLLLRKTNTDICFLGDGEKSWVKFLDYVTTNETKRNYDDLLKIKGIAFINKDGEMEFTGYGEPINAKDNPFPDYDLLASGLMDKQHLVKNYFGEGVKNIWFKNDPRTYEPNRRPNLALVPDCKGCVCSCTFCQRFSQGYRLFDLEKLETHLDELKNKYNVGFIMIADENFGSVKSHAYNVARLLKKYDMLWMAGGVRCTSVNEEDIKFYNECGCTGLKLGIESGCQEILNVMEKKFSVDIVFSALEYAHKYNWFAPLLFCIGMPGESNETIMKTGKFVGKIGKMWGRFPIEIDYGAFFALPLPGTPLFEYAQLNGYIGTSNDEEELYLDCISDTSATKRNFLNMTGIAEKDVVFWDFLLQYEATREFYHSPPSTFKNQQIIQQFRFWEIIRLNLMTYLNNRLSHSRFVSKIPRPLIYIPMKNLFYIEFLFKGLLLPIFERTGRYKSKRKNKINIIDTNLSLRQVNKKLRESLSPPETLTERNQRLLYEGR